MLYITETIKAGGFKTRQYSTEDKKNIISYLRSFEPCKFTSEPVIDVFSGEKISDADNGYSDGVYTWYESEIYYFEKYDLDINKSFIDYVCVKKQG